MKKETLLLICADYDSLGVHQCSDRVKSRCEWAVRFIQRSPRKHFRVIICAGTPANKPNNAPLWLVIKECFERRLIEEGLSKLVLFTATPDENVWGTREEIHYAAKMLRTYKADACHTVTTWHRTPQATWYWALFQNQTDVEIDTPLPEWYHRFKKKITSFFGKKQSIQVH